MGEQHNGSDGEKCQMPVEDLGGTLWGMYSRSQKGNNGPWMTVIQGCEAQPDTSNTPETLTDCVLYCKLPVWITEMYLLTHIGEK